MILADPRNPTAQRTRDELLSRLPEVEDANVTIVIGGDGFMLHTVAQHGLDKTYLGLNAGRIGFLMNDVDDWEGTLDRLRRRAWEAWAFPVLHATLTLEDGTVREVHAINDVALERSTGQTAHLGLTLDVRQVVDRLVADGIVFCTALGSTAYNFSAGGPACHPTLPMLGVTAVAPHHPRLAPIVLHATATGRVQVHDAHRRPVRAVADGVTIADNVSTVVVRIGPKKVRFAWLEGNDFTARMITKILRP